MAKYIFLQEVILQNVGGAYAEIPERNGAKSNSFPWIQLGKEENQRKVFYPIFILSTKDSMLLVGEGLSV